jgi:general secretion pathway protein J
VNGRPARSGGFTLLELLIGLVLLAITLTIAFAALRFSGRSLERTDALVGDIEEIRVARSVMQRQLAQARPLIHETPQRRMAFRGEPQQLEFVAPVPAQDGRLAGMYHYRLHFVVAANGTQLVLDYQPYIPDGTLDWREGHDSAVLAQGLAGGGFSYFGQARAQEAEEWIEHWPVAEAMPLLVQVQLAHGADRVPWPELVVPLRAHRVR